MIREKNLILKEKLIPKKTDPKKTDPKKTDPKAGKSGGTDTKKTPTKKSARGKGEDDLYFFCLKKANKGKSKYLPATEITVKKDKNQNVISVIDKKKKKRN